MSEYSNWKNEKEKISKRFLKKIERFKAIQHLLNQEYKNIKEIREQVKKMKSSFSEEEITEFIYEISHKQIPLRTNKGHDLRVEMRNYLRD